MKNKPIQRLLSLLMVCTMLFGLLAVSASAEEPSGPELKLVNTATGPLKKGDSFTVEVQFPKEQEFSNFELYFEFDREMFKLKSVNTGYSVEVGGQSIPVSYIPNFAFATNLEQVTDKETNKTYSGEVAAMISTTDTFNSSASYGILFTMDFEVLKCSSQEQKISLYNKKFQKSTSVDTFDNITPTITPATITVAHDLTAVAAKDATCTEAGNTAYWTCSGCDAWFSDPEGQDIIEDQNSVTRPARHETSDVWTHDENGHWHACTKCTDKVDYAAHSGGTATCQAQAVCEVCQQSYGSKADHSYEIQHDATQHWQHCTVCKTDIEKKDHTWGDWQTMTKPTCHSKGEKQHTCTFVGCGQTETGDIEMTDHSWGDWTEQDGQMVRKCQNVGCTATDQMTSVTVSFTRQADGTYDGNAHPLSDFVNAATVNGSSDNITYWMNGQEVNLDSTTVTNAGTYTVKAVYQNDEQKQYGTAEVSFIIQPKTVNVSGWTWDYSTAFTYDGEAKTVKLNVSDLTGVTVTYTDNQKTNAGTYTAKAAVKAANSNYLVEGQVADQEWKINPAEVTAPTAATGLKYNNGTSLTGVADSELYTVTGGTGMDAGTYTATVILKDKDNYCWSDTGNSGDRQIPWSIAQADALALTGSKSLLYSNAAEQTVTVTDVTNAAEAVLTNVTAPDSKSILAKAELEDGVVTYALKSGLTKADASKTAQLTIRFTSKNYEESTYTLTITVSDKTDVSDKISFENGQATYNGQKQIYEAAKFDGQTSDKFTYSYNEDPIQAGIYSVTATYEDATRYGTKTASFQILPAPLTITGGTVETKTYNGTTDAHVTGVTFSGLVNGESVTEYTVSNSSFDNANAGTNKNVTFTVALGREVKNYTLGSDVTGSARGTIQPLEVTVTVSDIEGSFTYTGSAQTPGVTVSATGTLDGYVLVKDTDYTVRYADNIHAGQAAVAVESKSGSNYTFVSVTKHFSIEKATPNVSAENITLYYTGRTLATSFIKGTANFQNQNVPGSWSWVTEPAGVDVGTYEASVRFTPNDASNLNAVDQNITVTIHKANPVGEPSYKTIDQSGKTLADAELGLGTLPEGGTIVWIDSEGNVLADDTKVEANQTYTWRYTPVDTKNYNERTGSVTLYTYQYIPITPSKPGSATTTGTKPTQTVRFGDVAKSDWYYEPVLYVCEKGLMNGTGNGKFEPNANTTRGMIVTILARVEGVNTSGNLWYAAGQTWAMENGISDGTNMEGSMTREQLATILFRYAEMKGYNVNKTAALTAFSDADQVSSYAVEAMQWATAEGLVQGSDGKLDPNGTATRAQVAMILMRFMEKFVK